MRRSQEKRHHHFRNLFFFHLSTSHSISTYTYILLSLYLFYLPPQILLSDCPPTFARLPLCAPFHTSSQSSEGIYQRSTSCGIRYLTYILNTTRQKTRQPCPLPLQQHPLHARMAALNPASSPSRPLSPALAPAAKTRTSSTTIIPINPTKHHTSATPTRSRPLLPAPAAPRQQQHPHPHTHTPTCSAKSSTTTNTTA